MPTREALGQIVRAAWVAYCISVGDTKPSHIAPWEELSEADKEADRVIGVAVAKFVEEDLRRATMGGHSDTKQTRS